MKFEIQIFPKQNTLCHWYPTDGGLTVRGLFKRPDSCRSSAQSDHDPASWTNYRHSFFVNPNFPTTNDVSFDKFASGRGFGNRGMIRLIPTNDSSDPSP